MMKLSLIRLGISLAFAIPSVAGQTTSTGAVACGRGRSSYTVGLKESTDSGAYSRTIHRKLGGGAYTSVDAYDSNGLKIDPNKLYAYGDDFEQIEIYAMAVKVTEKDENGFMGLGWKLRTNQQAEVYMRNKMKQLGYRREMRRKMREDRHAERQQSRTKTTVDIEEDLLQIKLLNAERKLLNAERRALRAHGRGLQSSTNEIANTAVLRFGFGCQHFNKLNIAVSNLGPSESGQYRAYLDGDLTGSATFTGSSDPATVFNINVPQGFDTLEFAVDPSNPTSSYLIQYIEYCKPETCTGSTGTFTGDPHLTTFDRLRWDCMGKGHFLVVLGEKANGDRPMQVQAIFDKPDSRTRQMTQAKATLVDSGFPGAPVIQLMTPREADSDGKCLFHLFVNGKAEDLATWDDPSDKAILMTQGTSLECFTRWRNGSGRKITITYPDTDLQVSVWSSKTGAHGCVVHTNVCLGSYWDGVNNKVRGLFGNNNGNQSDDWQYQNGTYYAGGVVTSGNKKKQAAYDFCTNNWCLNERQSQFVYLPGENFTTFDRCAPPYVPPKKSIQDVVKDHDSCQETLNFCRNISDDDDDNEDCLLEAGADLLYNKVKDCKEGAENYADDKDENKRTVEKEGYYEPDDEDKCEEPYNPGGAKTRAPTVPPTNPPTSECTVNLGEGYTDYPAPVINGQVTTGEWPGLPDSNVNLYHASKTDKPILVTAQVLSDCHKIYVKAIIVSDNAVYIDGNTADDTYVKINGKKQVDASAVDSSGPNQFAWISDTEGRKVGFEASFVPTSDINFDSGMNTIRIHTMAFDRKDNEVQTAGSLEDTICLKCPAPITSAPTIASTPAPSPAPTVNPFRSCGGNLSAFMVTATSSSAHAVKVKNSDLGADIMVLSNNLVHDNVDLQIKSYFMLNKWVDDANGQTCLPGAGQLFQGISWGGDIALTSPSSKFDSDNMELYAMRGVCSVSSNAVGTVTNSKYFNAGNMDPVLDPNTVIRTMPNQGVNSMPDYVGTIRSELIDYEHYLTQIKTEVVLSPGNGLPSSNGINEQQIFEMNVDKYDVNGDGVAVIDIEMPVGQDFEIKNSNFIIESAKKTFAVFRILGENDFIVKSSSIVIGDGTVGNAASATQCGQSSFSYGRLGAVFVKASRFPGAATNQDGVPMSSSAKLFDFDKFVVNGVGFYDLVAFQFQEGNNDNGRTKASFTNGQGCAHFVSPDITFEDVRLERCSCKGDGDFQKESTPSFTTGHPTKAPTKIPTKIPTKEPTKRPTKAPTVKPTKAPTVKPTKAPTVKPTKLPTKAPTIRPTPATSSPTMENPFKICSGLVKEYLMIGTGSAQVVGKTLDLKSSDLGADIVVLSTQVNDNVDLNLRDFFLYSVGKKWVANTDVPDCLPGAGKVHQGVSMNGDVAITSPNGKFDASNVEFYGFFGVVSANSNPGGSVTNTNFYTGGNTDPVLDSSSVGLPMPSNGVVSDVATMLDLRDELIGLENYLTTLQTEHTLSPGNGLPTSGGIENVDVFELKVDGYDTNDDGIAVIDIDMNGASAFTISNSNWIIESTRGTFAVFRILGNTDVVLNHASIMIGDGVMDNVGADGCGNSAFSFGSLGAVFLKAHDYPGSMTSGEENNSNDIVFDLSNVVLNGVAIYDLVSFSTKEGNNDFGTTSISVQNGQGCAQFISSKLSFTNVRFEKCSCDSEGTRKPTPPVPSTNGPTEEPTKKPTPRSIAPEPTPKPTSNYEPGGTKTKAPTKRPSGVNGDPHFKTWSGEKYDFHGICDLVLLQNHKFRGGKGMDIHVRSKQTRQWSYVSTAVVRIGGETFEVAGRNDGDCFWLNRVQGDVLPKDAKIAGYPITYQELHAQQYEYVINLGMNETIGFRVWRDLVRVDVNGKHIESFKGSLGLMGSFPNGTRFGRDGETLMQTYTDFGEEWQVLALEPKLFHEIDGPQFPERCEVPTKMALRRRLAESTISKQEAEVACAHVQSEDERDLCIFDVVAMDTKDAANAY